MARLRPLLLAAGFVLWLVLPAAALDLPTAVVRALLVSQQALNRGDYAAARTPLLNYLQHYPRQPHGLIYLGLGNSWYLQEKYPQAYADYRQAYRLLPDQATIVRNLAATAIQLEKFADAAPLFEAAWSLSDDEGHLLYTAGVCWYRAGRSDEARRVLRRLWKGRTDGPIPWLRLWAVVELDGGATAPVRDRVNALLGKTPAEKDLWQLAGQLALAGRDYPAAVAALEVLYRLQPPTALQQQQMAALYAHLRFPLAAARWESRQQDSLRQAAWWEQAGRDREATGVLRHLADDSPAALRRLAEILYRQGDWQEARQRFLALARQEPDNGRPFVLAAYCALELNRLDQALEDLRQAQRDERYRHLSRSLTDVLRPLVDTEAGQAAGMEKKF